MPKKTNPLQSFASATLPRPFGRTGTFIQRCSQGHTKKERTGKTLTNWPVATL
jgi:hypothetical protein